MYLTLANSASMAAAASDSDIAALTDPQVTIQNSHFLLPDDMRLLAAYGMGASVTKLKIDSPKMREVYLPFVRPLDRSATPGDEPNICDFTDFELTFRRAEEIKFLISNDAGAPEQEYVISFWGDGRRSVNFGPMYTMLCTSTITTVANSWTAGNLTFDQSLPAGRYSIVGMEAYGTGLIAARLILPGYFHRPGCVAGQNAGQFTGRLFRKGYLGELGQFSNVALPSVEVLKGSAAATACTFTMDLIKVG